MNQKPWTDEEVDIRMGRLLRAGVILSALLMTIGAAVYLIDFTGPAPDYRNFQGAALPLRAMSGILRASLRGEGRGLIQLAVLLMIATPVARVLFAVYAFVRQADWLYMMISLTVLLLLLYGLIFGV